MVPKSDNYNITVEDSKKVFSVAESLNHPSWRLVNMASSIITNTEHHSLGAQAKHMEISNLQGDKKEPVLISIENK